MKKDRKRLGYAELEMMQAVWAAGEPVSAAQIQSALIGKRDWALATVMTSLRRLCDKGFLLCEKTGRNNRYSALIGEEAYRQDEGRTMLEKLYGNSITGLVASLVDGHSVSEEDLRDLRQLLDHWEERR